MLSANQDQIDVIKSIDNATERLQKYVHKQLTQLSIENAIFITKYIECQKTEINLSDTYRHTVITSLITLSRYFNNKDFRLLTRPNMINYFDSLRKSEDVDPTHKWIGTYNLKKKIFLKFFKWVYSPDEEAKNRPIPEIMQDIMILKREEQSIYKPDDLWSLEDDRLFLDYCPDKRMRCYHVIARDTSARPSEILKLRVKEITFKHAG
jgi:hypothetical protein